MIWLRAITFILLVQVTVVGLIPWWLSRLGPRLDLGSLRTVGLIPLAGGVALLVACNVLFVQQGHGTAAPYDPPRTLVVRGPYRYVRNPMYVSALLIVLGLGLWMRATSLLLYAIVLAVAYNIFVRYYEEPRLTALFGEAYTRYVAQVPRWRPRLTGPRSP